MSDAATVLSPVLVGRDGHLEVADARLADAAAGHGRTLLIAGEAGIGKTRLLRAIIRRARTTGFIYAKGDIAPQDRDLPGALLLDLARMMRDDPAMAAAGRAILERWSDASSRGGAGSRKLVLDVVETLRSAVTGPTIFAFEDLQWADDRSLEAIGELARTIEHRPVLILAAYRRDETPADAPIRAWRARLLTQRQAEEIRLDRLSRAQTATMVSLLAGTDLPAPRDVVDAVHERSDGVPLHIEELVAAVRARGPLDATSVRAVGVPDTIEDAVIARTGRLSPEAQAVARAGAVLGRCFVPEVLAGVMDVPVAELEAPLEELVEHAILFPFGERDRGYHDFRHQLLREALYQHTPTRERRRYHARAAEFGAALEGASEIHASIHYAEAGLPDEAYRAALAGAEAAARVNAHREAYELYRRAEGYQPSDLPAAARGSLAEAVALQALALEETAVAIDRAWAAADAHREAGDVPAAIAASTLVVVAWRRDGHPVSARIELCRRLQDELDGLVGADVAELRADLGIYEAFALVDAYRLDEARDVLDRIRGSAWWHRSEDTRLVVEEVQAMIDFVEVGPDAGLERIAAAAAAALADGLETASLSGTRDASILAARAIDYPAARRFIDDGIRFGAEVEQAHCAHVMAGVGAVVSWATGAWDDAVRDAPHIVADRGCRRGAAHARWAIGYLALGRGDAATARRELEDALEWAERSESLDLILPPAWGLAELDLVTGRPAEAADRAAWAFERAQAVGDRALLVPFLVTGVRALQAAGRPSEAERWSTDVADYLGDGLPFARPALDHAAGLVALAAGNTGVARTALEAAVAGWGARERVWEASWARLDLAAAFARTNRYAAAVAVAGQVRETAAALGAVCLVERADEQLRLARGRVAVEEPWRPLTAREFQIACLIGDGRTNLEIADALGIAPKTASSHVEHILAKLGASRRAEIATWASRVSSRTAAS